MTLSTRTHGSRSAIAKLAREAEKKRLYVLSPLSWRVSTGPAPGKVSVISGEKMSGGKEGGVGKKLGRVECRWSSVWERAPSQAESDRGAGPSGGDGSSGGERDGELGEERKLRGPGDAGGREMGSVGGDDVETGVAVGGRRWDGPFLVAIFVLVETSA